MAASQTADIVRLHLCKISFQRERLQHQEARAGPTEVRERELSNYQVRPGQLQEQKGAGAGRGK